MPLLGSSTDAPPTGGAIVLPEWEATHIGGRPGHEEVQVRMRPLKVLLAVDAAMAMLLTATSLATATPILDTGYDPCRPVATDPRWPNWPN